MKTDSPARALTHDLRFGGAFSALVLLALGSLPTAAHAQAATGSPPLAPSPSAAAVAAGGVNPGTTASDVTAPDENQTPIKLNPFEVDATNEHGYFSPNTLAGTRLNNNIADIPSSVTVVTKQELLDTNSYDINDVFRYQANTEGASTYTPVTLVRSNVGDTLANSYATSGNRVRGLSAADLETDNFFSANRIPFDSYNTQSLEIDRGPNSILFGTGSPAGIVNQSRAEAVLNKTSGDFSLVGSNTGTYRDTAALNLSIIPDKLAIYLAQEFTSRGFKQKPSADLTRREYAAFTFVPFKNHKTKLSGSFEYYNNYNNDPNSLTPVDFVTPWLASGKPVYNPITDMVNYLSTGKTSGPYALATTSPNYSGILQTALTTTTSPYFVPGLTYESAHNIMFIDQGTIENFYRAQQTSFSVSGFVPSTLTPAQALVNEEKVTWSVNLPFPAQYQVWQAPSITSKSIYDWSDININSIANATTSAKIYHLDFQQEIVPNLNFDFGWFRQEIHQLSDQPLSQANASTMYVDTNSYLLDGRANPFVGQPFVDAYQSDIFQSPEINNNFRGSLEYELNLADKVPDWLKWLGHHRFMTVFTQHDDIQTSLRYRESIDGGDPNYLPTAASLSAATGYSYAVSNATIEQWYYLGGATGNPNGYASQAPGILNRSGNGGPTSANVETYNYATGQWITTPLHFDSLLYPSGGLSENLQDTKTYFWQSFFWNNRIVGTMGLSDDQVKNRQTVFPTTNPTAVEYTNGFANTPYWYNEGPWSYIGGNTSSTGLVVHPLQRWSAIDAAANDGNLLAAFGRTISLTFNKSANFNPPPAFYTDFYGNPLPKPEGKEKDYGLEISTPDNKLFLRVTWFNTQNENQQISNTSNARALYIDQTELKNWATAVVEVRNGQSPSDPNFGNVSVYPLSVAEQNQIAALTGLPYNFGGNVGQNGQFINPYETENGVAKGTEVELTYNPLSNFRMKFAWGYQKTILTDIADQAANWVNYRMPTWLSYTAPDLNQVYTKSSGSPLYLGNFWQSYGYDGNVTGPGNASGYTTTQAYYNIVVGAQLATDRALNGTQASNQRSYTWSYVTSYDFDRGPLKGFTAGGALRFLGQAIAGYYGDTNNLSPSGQIFQPNIHDPIYFRDEYHIDAWVSYHFKMPWSNGRIRGLVQLNGTDLNIHGYLQPVTFNLDGSPAAERIIQPTAYTVTTRFSF